MLILSRFSQIGVFHLRQMLAAAGVDAEEAGGRAEHILGTFLEAPPVEDAGTALRQLHGSGIQVLTNRIQSQCPLNSCPIDSLFVESQPQAQGGKTRGLSSAHRWPGTLGFRV